MDKTLYKFIYIAVFLLLMICLFWVIFSKPVNYTAEKVNTQINSLTNYITSLSENKSELSYSSNPYDYIKSNESYRNIVDLGYKAIPYINSAIKNSSENGLREYLLAISVEEISVVNLKAILEEKYSYNTAKNFSNNYELFLRELPKNIDNIINSSDKDVEKNDKLKQLGIASIPYIVEKNKNGAFDDAIITLSKKVKGLECEALELKDLNKFIVEKKSVIDDLKNLKSN